MDFKKSLEVNGKNEELIFISWNDDNITNFIILGFESPLFMRYNFVSHSWEFIDKVDDTIAPYEALFSNMIMQHLPPGKISA